MRFLGVFSFGTTSGSPGRSARRAGWCRPRAFMRAFRTSSIGRSPSQGGDDDAAAHRHRPPSLIRFSGWMRPIVYERDGNRGDR